MRTTAEVFDSHLLYTLDWDIESDIELNYAPHCYLISSYGVFWENGNKKSFRCSGVSDTRSQLPVHYKNCLQ